MMMIEFTLISHFFENYQDCCCCCSAAAAADDVDVVVVFGCSFDLDH